jgi:hypothetical protein
MHELETCLPSSSEPRHDLGVHGAARGLEMPPHGSRRARSVPPTANESRSVSSIRSRRLAEAKAASALRRERPWLLGSAEWPLVAVLPIVVTLCSPRGRCGGALAHGRGRLRRGSPPSKEPRLALRQPEESAREKPSLRRPKITPTGDRAGAFRAGTISTSYFAGFQCLAAALRHEAHEPPRERRKAAIEGREVRWLARRRRCPAG